VIDRALLDLARRQHGVIGVSQLIDELRWSPATVSRSRRNGTLIDVSTGVVRLASSPESFRSRCMITQLRSGDNGFLSGWTAARLHGLRAMPSTPIHVTVDHRFRRSMPEWTEVHPTRWYDLDDQSEIHEGFTIATPLRMLWGLAASFNQFRFERAAEDAWHLGLVTPGDAAAYLEAHRCRGKDGVRRFEAWLDHALSQQRPAQSNLERRLLDALHRTGLPQPVRQHPLTLATGETIHLDIAWPAIRLAVEPGANWWHGGNLRMGRDQARDRACVELGWQVIRFDESIIADLGATANQVARIHRQRTIDTRNVPRS
jgi:very-short-patch-repair endonuclease